MDIKQLRYFIACVEAGSISEAAKILYTTQSSVSKVIKALESSLGSPLFERLPRGIRLTAQGRKIYHSACKIVSEINLLENTASHGPTKWLRISTNPSSWFADQFVDFYNEIYDKDYHFQITAAGVRIVMERVRDYLDDIGFVYILDEKKEDFLYELSRNKLIFTPLYTTDLLFYPGKKNGLYGADKTKLHLKDAATTRFIQNYQDEYFDIETLQESGSTGWNGLDISILTNSDYIMEKMLRTGNVANISGSYLPAGKRGENPGILLNTGENRVIFGFIFHKEEEIDEGIRELIEFLKKSIRGIPK